MDICIELAPVDASAPKFFGFSEFLTSLALMVLAWTTTDVRYRFRILSAPISLQHLTFKLVTTVGVLTLLTDLWRAEQWPVPTFIPLTLGSWQAIMGGTLLLTFIFWVRLAFIHPPVYNIYNAKRFTQALYLIILKGSKEELPIIADELTHSMKNIVTYATEEQENPEKNTQDTQEVQIYANTILALIADRRFCKTIASSSPITAIALYIEMNKTKKYRIPVKIFTKNLVNEAIGNKNSFLYQETNGYQSGFIGSQKPLSQTLFSNYKMSEAIGTTLLIDIKQNSEWDNFQWDAYLRIVLITLENFDPNENEGRSLILGNALRYVRSEALEIGKPIHDVNTSPGQEQLDRIDMIIEFTKSSIKALNKKNIKPSIKTLTSHRQRIGKYKIYSEIIYDEIANLMTDIIISSSRVTDKDLKSQIRLLILSKALFYGNAPEGHSERIIQMKYRRNIYDNIKYIKTNPSIFHALLLRFYINTFGIETFDYEKKSGNFILSKAIIRWIKNNYDWMYNHEKDVAITCLGDHLCYDSTNYAIIRKHQPPLKSGERNILLYVNPSEPPPIFSSPNPAEH